MAKVKIHLRDLERLAPLTVGRAVDAYDLVWTEFTPRDFSQRWVTITGGDVARLARYHARDTKHRAHLDAEIRACALGAEREERRERLAHDAQRLADTRRATALILSARRAS